MKFIAGLLIGYFLGYIGGMLDHEEDEYHLGRKANYGS